MTKHSGSILRKLQMGFALSAVVLAGLLALFMDHALHRAMHLDDLADMQGHAKLLQEQLASGNPLRSPRSTARPEKVDWRVVDNAGRILAQSPDLEGFPALPMTGPSEEIQVLQVGGEVFSLLVRPWSRQTEWGQIQLVINQTHTAILARQFRHTLVVGVLLAALAAALLARIIARWGLAPLGALIQETAAINSRNLERRLATEHFPMELQELVATLNTALARLQTAFERLGNLGAELAHELRTPLQNLRSTLENRIVQAGTRPVAVSELGMMVEDCDRMAALIEQILFIARVEHSPTGLTRDLLSLRAVFEEAHGFFEAAAEEAGIDLQVEGEAGVQIRGDRLLLTRAVHNLLSNALRHTPRGGWVKLAAEEVAAEVELSVEDNGSGIDEAWVSRLGTPFVRPPEARPTEGHGLGLAIVKQVATMLGGRMRVESQVGRGTRVVLVLPKASQI